MTAAVLARRGAAGRLRTAQEWVTTSQVYDIAVSVNSYTFPTRPRPNEPLRRELSIRNTGTTSLQVAYGTSTDNANTNSPAAGQWSEFAVLAPGQEFRDLTGRTNSIFVRPNTSGQGGQFRLYVVSGVS